MLEQAFVVGGSGGDNVGTWLDAPVGSPSHILGESFCWDFLLTFISSKRNDSNRDDQCNVQAEVSLLILKWALGIALIQIFFVLSFWKWYTDIRLLRRIAFLNAGAVDRRCSVKKVFLQISQNSQEITSGTGENRHRCFPENFAKFLRTVFIIEQLRWLLLYMHMDNTSFPYLISNKYLINSFDSFDKIYWMQNLYIYCMLCF